MFREKKEILKRVVEVHPKGLFEGELLKDIGYDEGKCKELLGNLVQLGWWNTILIDTLSLQNEVFTACCDDDVT